MQKLISLGCGFHIMLSEKTYEYPMRNLTQLLFYYTLSNYISSIHYLTYNKRAHRRLNVAPQPKRTLFMKPYHNHHPPPNMVVE